MLSGACLGSNDLVNAKAFYDAVLSTIDMKLHIHLEHELGYGPSEGDPNFWVVTPFNEEVATYGNGTQIIFQARTKKAVQAFYKAALEMGGRDEGQPGPRDYAPGYYGAYVRDPDNNKLHVSLKL